MIFPIPPRSASHLFSYNPSAIVTIICTIASFLLFQTYALDNLDSIGANIDYALPQASHGRTLTELADDRDIQESSSYEPDFIGVAREIIGRQDSQTATPLSNNVPSTQEISPGSRQFFEFPSTVLYGPYSSATPIIPPVQQEKSGTEVEVLRDELRKKDTEPRQVYITLSVCDQPSPESQDASDPPPQLLLFISLTPSNTRPGTNGLDTTVPPPVVEGFGSYLNPFSDDVYIGVEALQNTGYSGNYQYEITASIDAPYSWYNDMESLYHIDSDSGASFFMSMDMGNLTSATNAGQVEPSDSDWLNLRSRFGIFVHNQNDTQIAGLRRSYCGLKKHAQIIGNVGGHSNVDAEVAMTLNGGDGHAKQQFYVPGLNKSSSYQAIMALDSYYASSGNGTPTGGGTVWKAIDFTTKSDGNCQVIYNLSFCSNVNYAVPANPNLFNQTALTDFYDNQAESRYQFFDYSLQQIPCHTDNTAQYSLAVKCQNCSDAYKNWLCAVTIPRCEDYSLQKPYLQIRNTNQSFINGSVPSAATDPVFSAANRSILYLNSSRNPQIDAIIQPGPYKELLPCGSLCYSLVQSCPAALGFGCPVPGRFFNQSYGFVGNDLGSPMCNFPGALQPLSGSVALRPSTIMLAAPSVITLLVAYFGVDNF